MDRVVNVAPGVDVTMSSSGSAIGTLSIGPYEAGPVLQTDELSVTRLAVHTISGTLVAVRSFIVAPYCIDRSGDSVGDGGSGCILKAAAVEQQWISSKEFCQLLVTVNRLKHPHVAPWQEIYRSPRMVHTVTSFAHGGTLMNAVRMRFLKSRERLQEASGAFDALEDNTDGIDVNGDVTSSSTSWYFESRLNEDEARFYFHQLISAIRYAHEQAGMHHGGLTLDDLWLDAPLPSEPSFSSIDKHSYQQRPRMRVANFGASAIRAQSIFADNLFSHEALLHIVESGGLTELQQLLQSVSCVAPELMIPSMETSTTSGGSSTQRSGSTVVPLSDDAMKRCDVWSCGVILYMMIAGDLPFHLFGDDDDANINQGDSYNASATSTSMRSGKAALFATATSSVGALRNHLGEYVRRVNNASFGFPNFFSRGVRGVRHLIGSMLVADPAKRITIDQIVAHPWFDIRLERSLFPTMKLESGNRPQKQ